MRRSIPPILIVALSFLASLPSEATCTGSSPSWTSTITDYQDCHDNHAVNGDTITIVPGTYTVSSTGLAMTKFLTLVGTGVTIRDDLAAADLLTVTESSAGNSRVTGFTFRGVNTSDVSGTHGLITLNYNASGGKPVRIDRNTFYSPPQFGGPAALRQNSHRGVFDHNALKAFDDIPNVVTWEALVSKAALSTWPLASTMGTADTDGTNNFYFETNTVTNIAQWFDCDQNTRAVMRYNTIQNSKSVSHGLDSAAISCRHVEWYNNTFVFADNADVCVGGGLGAISEWIGLRGGTMVVTDNVGLIPIPARCGCPSCVYGAGHAISLLTLNPTRRYNSPGDSGSGAIYNPCWGGDSPPALEPGQAWPVPQQVGQGNDGTKTLDAFGSTNFVEAIYIWNNTGSPDVLAGLDPANECPGAQSTVSTWIQSGRDYIIGTSKPSYTKYPYPHQLSSATTTIPGGWTIRPGTIVK